MEHLRGFIVDKLASLKSRKVDLQRENDYSVLVGYVTPSLAQFFSAERVGFVNPEETSQGLEGPKGALRRLLARKGNTIGKIAREVVKKQAQENLMVDIAIRNSFEAIVQGCLRRLQGPDVK